MTTTPSQSTPLQAIQANVALIRQDLNTRFLERTREIDGLFVAMQVRLNPVSRKHSPLGLLDQTTTRHKSLPRRQPTKLMVPRIFQP